MKNIDAIQLIGEGYSWDQDWDRELGKSYWWPGCVLLIVFFGSGVSVVGELISPTTAAVSMVSSGVALLFLALLAYRSSPTSPVTGKRLSKYRNRSPLTAGAMVEVVYVDHETRKFFVHAWMKNAEDHLDVG
jgi:hypothetical protein